MASGGRFLVGLKDATSSEKILKIKSVLKEGIDIDNNVKVGKKDDEMIESLLLDIDIMDCSPENVLLSEDSREVSVHIAGYIAKKLKKRFGSCCHEFLMGDSITSDCPDFSYMQILSRGGLTIPSINLANYVCTAFAILDVLSGAILKSKLISRLAAEHVLKHIFNSYETFTCITHENTGQTFVNRTIANIYFNNKRKISTDSVVADGVKAFKKRQREKRSNVS